MRQHGGEHVGKRGLSDPALAEDHRVLAFLVDRIDNLLELTIPTSKQGTLVNRRRGRENLACL
jgi:hypothetical protein